MLALATLVSAHPHAMAASVDAFLALLAPVSSVLIIGEAVAEAAYGLAVLGRRECLQTVELCVESLPTMEARAGIIAIHAAAREVIAAFGSAAPVFSIAGPMCHGASGAFIPNYMMLDRSRCIDIHILGPICAALRQVARIADPVQIVKYVVTGSDAGDFDAFQGYPMELAARVCCTTDDLYREALRYALAKIDSEFVFVQGIVASILASLAAVSLDPLVEHQEEIAAFAHWIIRRARSGRMRDGAVALWCTLAVRGAIAPASQEELELVLALLPPDDSEWVPTLARFLVFGLEQWRGIVGGRFKELAAFVLAATPTQRSGIEPGVLETITDEFIGALRDGELLRIVGEKEETAMRIERTITALKGE
jgi:hypothetical protein